jgi:hypothetical protein
MVTLTTNVPHSSAEPRIVVDNKLEPGKYRFRLVVLDEAKNASLPSEIVIEVQPRQFRPIDPDILVRPDIFIRPDVITQPTGPVIRPDVVKPDVIRPDVFRPDVLRPDVLRPDVVKPVITPEVVKPAGPAINPEIIARPIKPADGPALNPAILRPFKPRNPIG